MEVTAAMRNKVVRLLLVIPMLAAGLALGAPTPAAAALVCETGRFESFSGTFKGDIVVLAGGNCILSGAVVRGGVTVQTGARFSISAGTEIRGSVTMTDTRDFDIISSVVRGGVTGTGFSGGADDGSFSIELSEIRGDVVLTGLSAHFVQITRNTVRGSMILRNNTPRSQVTVTENTISVNLECTGNLPLPLNLRPNTVGGVTTGDCIPPAGP